jgi:NAD(P)-dependent dehydrogenase (short-subunit alcohol dehydrogenase family)
MLLENKVAIVVGAGQTPGETIGNGRATAIRFAREGARLLLVDKRVDSAEETARMILQERGDARSSVRTLHSRRIVGLLPPSASSATDASISYITT